MVTQPKSIATVVVVLVDAGPGSSRPNPTEVISASVVSGAISEMAPTAVVLPTPKPPATTIFTGIGAAFAGRAGRSGECTESTNHSHDEVGGVRVEGVLVVHVDEAGHPQVTHQAPGDTDVQPQPGGDLRHRQRFLAEGDDGPQLRAEPAGRRLRP